MAPPYRFSIVIPTRNRPHTLRSTLATCLDQEGFSSYEIVISDNSDNNDTRKMVDRLVRFDRVARQRIKYGRPQHVCCMSSNFEEAIRRAEGEYIIVIGDDDGVMPKALLELDKLASQTGAEIIKWQNGLYNWPDMSFPAEANYLGFSVLRVFDVIDGKMELQRSVDSFRYDNLPMLYVNTAIRRKIVDQVRDKDGRLFRSRSPDVYSAVVLAYACGKFLGVTVPFTLAGLSNSSNGVSTAFDGSNVKPRSDFKTLNAAAGIVHHPHVPDLAAFPVVDIADSFYHAKHHHFAEDAQFVLCRKRVLRACIERVDTSLQSARAAILAACEDDPELTHFALGLMDVGKAPANGPRLRPEHLGADGANLHVDGRDFGFSDIAGAVKFVDKIVWPRGAPLRYDFDLPVKTG